MSACRTHRREGSGVNCEHSLKGLVSECWLEIGLRADVVSVGGSGVYQILG